MGKYKRLFFFFFFSLYFLCVYARVAFALMCTRICLWYKYNTCLFFVRFYSCIDAMVSNITVKISCLNAQWRQINMKHAQKTRRLRNRALLEYTAYLWEWFLTNLKWFMAFSTLPTWTTQISPLQYTAYLDFSLSLSVNCPHYCLREIQVVEVSTSPTLISLHTFNILPSSAMFELLLTW